MTVDSIQIGIVGTLRDKPLKSFYHSDSTEYMSSKNSKPKSPIFKLFVNSAVRIPQLVIRDANGGLIFRQDLSKEGYLLGRSNKQCEISIDNGIVSEKHLSVTRDKNKRNGFILEDLGSKNGTYQGKHKIREPIPLLRGDKFTLGSPENSNRVIVSFEDPLPLGKKILLYTLYGLSGLVAVSTLYCLSEWNKVNVKNIHVVNAGVKIYTEGLKEPFVTTNQNDRGSDNKISDFPDSLPEALTKSEDANFYLHLGLDPLGIGRAFIVNLTSKQKQGASTISQQLARTLFPEYVGSESDKSYGRKLREAIIALKLESAYSKDDLILLYLNHIYLGERRGFENASQLYFGKPAKNMSMSEAATLIAMLQAPNKYNPCVAGGADGKSIKQRNIVVRRLVQVGMLKEEEGDTIRRTPDLSVNENACKKYVEETKAPYFYNYVKEEVRSLLGTGVFEEGNFAVETGIDLKMQEKAESAFSKTMITAGSKYNFNRGAIVTLDKDTGLIKAMVGGGNYNKQQQNDAVFAQRSPGSTFKLFAYTAAIEAGIPPTKTYSCAQLTWDGRAFPGCNHVTSGLADMYAGFAKSDNTIALRVAQDATIEKVMSTAQKMGIKSKLEAVPGLILGQSAVNPLEITGAYSTIASGGVWHKPKSILRIYDTSSCKEKTNISTCIVRYDATKESAAQPTKYTQSVLTPAVASTMTSLMRGVVTNGTGKNANISGLYVVGKTGTAEKEGSKQNTDIWFIGFVKGKSEVTGIWFGNESSNETMTATSAQAAQAWNDYMSSVYH